MVIVIHHSNVNIKEQWFWGISLPNKTPSGFMTYEKSVTVTWQNINNLWRVDSLEWNGNLKFNQVY